MSAARVRTLGHDRDGDAAAARAEVQRARTGRVTRAKILPGQFGEPLGFRTRRQHVTVHFDFQSAEAGRTEDVLERFAVAAPPHQFPRCFEFRRRQFPVEIEIQLQPWHEQDAAQ